MDFPFSIIPSPQPASAAPFGHESGDTVLGLTFATLALEIICVALRLYTRLFILRRPGWDDLCVLLGALCTIGISVTAHYMVVKLLPGGLDNLNFDSLTIYMKGNYITLAIFPICMGFIKAALMLQFRRIFDPKSIAHRFSTVVLIIVVLWSIAFGIISIFPCTPVSKVWNPFVEGHCYGLGSPVLDRPSYLKTLIAQAASNMFLDLVILGLAAYLMKGSGGSGRSGFQIRLGALIVIGLLANLCAVAKTVFVVRMLQEADNISDPTTVMPWGVTLLTCEVNLAAICASVPIFWSPLQEVVLAKWNSIFVTDEVTVVRSARYRSDQDRDDERDLTQPTISRSDSTTDVDVELSHIAVGQPDHTHSHYKDEFVQSYINPLRNNNSERLGGTTVQSQARRHRKWYHLK